MEIRRLTEEELNSLIETAPDTETRNLKRILSIIGMSAYDFFNSYAVEHFGLINSRPLYFGCLINNGMGEKELWTVVNSGVKEQLSLFKYSKRQIQEWSRKYSGIYATMEKCNHKNIEWTKRLGFIPTKETENLITLRLGVDKC